MKNIILDKELDIIYFLQQIIGKPLKCKSLFKKLIKLLTSRKQTYKRLLVLLYFTDVTTTLKAYILCYIAREFSFKIKNIFDIKRPFTYRKKIFTDKLHKPNTCSFPSTSTIVACIFYHYLLGKQFKYIPVLAIGLNRIYRGLHFPHDIITSIFIGNSFICFDKLF